MNDASRENDDGHHVLRAHELLERAVRERIAAARAAAARVIRLDAEPPPVRAEADPSAGAAPLSPGDGVDERAVHDFRVALRRLRTLLRAGREMYGERPMRRLGEVLATAASSAGTLRDGEVFAETLADLELSPGARTELARALARHRLAEEVRRAHVARRLRRAVAPAGRLESCLLELELRLAAGPRSDPEAAELGARMLAAAEAQLHRAARAEVTDVEAMHELRLRYKRVRYTAEAFASVLGQPATARAKQAARMQKKLGELHDLDDAIDRHRSAFHMTPGARAEIIGALRSRRDVLAARIETELAPGRVAVSQPTTPAHGTGAEEDATENGSAGAAGEGGDAGSEAGAGGERFAGTGFKEDSALGSGAEPVVPSD